jgi:hypothetical protein
VFEHCIERAMKVNDRALKESEREDAVRTAAKANLIARMTARS